jgi:hypothetical protein
MRFLKKKICRSKKLAYLKTGISNLLLKRKEQPRTEVPGISFNTKKILSYSNSKLRNLHEPKITLDKDKEILITKNVVKNYGRAIAAFACSELSLPYLLDIQRIVDYNQSSFMEYASKMKTTIQSIPSFRGSMVVEKNDSKSTAANKLVFQKIAEIFVKYFSVNWIFSSKLLYKLEYLKLRGIILKNIRAPETFYSL